MARSTRASSTISAVDVVLLTLGWCEDSSHPALRKGDKLIGDKGQPSEHLLALVA